MADFPKAQNLNPLLTGALRDPAKMQKDQVLAWMAEKQKEQVMQERGGGGFVQGLAPIIAALVATKSPGLGVAQLYEDLDRKLLGGRKYRDEPAQETLAVVPKNVKSGRASLLKAALDAGKSGPRTPYHDFLDKQAKLQGNFSGAQPWQKEYAATGKIPVVRVARDITAPSDRRLGAFYNVRTPTTLSDKNHYLTGGNSPLGGEVMYSATAAPRNPYVRNALEGSPDVTLSKLVGHHDAIEIRKAATYDEAGAFNILKKYGINNKELRHIWSANEGPWARRDAVVSKILSNQGYDALAETTPLKKSMYVPNTHGPTVGMPSDVNPSYRKDVGYLMQAPEVFKFREPRVNMSFDPKTSEPRGLNSLRFEGQFSSTFPQTPLTEKLVREFAKGRSPKLGEQGSRIAKSSALRAEEDEFTTPLSKSPQMPVKPNKQKIEEATSAIGLKPYPSIPGIYMKSDPTNYNALTFDTGGLVLGGNLNVGLDPAKAMSLSGKNLAEQAKKSLYKLDTTLPGMVQTKSLVNPETLSVIPGYSAKVYKEGAKLSKEKALDWLDNHYKHLFDVNAPNSGMLKGGIDEDIYNTILKSINQIKR